MVLPTFVLTAQMVFGCNSTRCLPLRSALYVPALGAAPHRRARPEPSRSCTFASQLKQSVTLNRRHLPTKIEGQSESRAAASHQEAEVLVSSATFAASTKSGCSACICDEGVDRGCSAAWYASASSIKVPTPAIGMNTRSVTATFRRRANCAVPAQSCRGAGLTLKS
jgi:hypothetical protein